MLSNVLETKGVEFTNLREGEKFLKGKKTREVILPSSALEVSQDGMLRSKGGGHEKVEARLTDFSLDLLHGILKIPKTYAERLEPPLHATNINELLGKRISPLVLTFEKDGQEGGKSHVVAILPSQPVTIPHEVILSHLTSRDLSGRVLFAPGYMEVRVAGSEEVEVLPQDVFSIEGSILNSQLGLRKWPFEISTFLTRLICANGMVARRQILSGKLGMWMQSPKRLAEYLDRRLEAALKVISSGLREAVRKMAGQKLDDDERKNLTEEVRRAAGIKFLERLFEKAVTVYDHLNEVTALANRLEDRERQRRLWVLGGRMMEKYFEGN